MIRVLYIISGLSTGGAETMLYKLIERLDRDRFTPLVISLTTLGEIGPRISETNTPVIALGLQTATPNPLLFFRLIKLIREFNPDIVHTWMYHADLLGGLASRLAGARRVIWCIRNSDLSGGNSKSSTIAVVKICAKISARIPSRILSCSNRASKIHINAGYSSNKISVIPNGFDLQRFQPDESARVSVRQELRLDGQTPIIGMIGRFDPQKNHLGFIEAASYIHKRQPKAHFLLAGTFVEHSNAVLSTAIRQANLDQHFHLLGRRDDIPRLMASLDVFVSSSSYGEAFPNVLGEAMACEIPCVVTDVGDSAEIVGVTGRVVEPENMRGIANHVLAILALPREEYRQLACAARQRIGTCYELGSITKQYQDFYISTINEDS